MDISFNPSGRSFRTLCPMRRAGHSLAGLASTSSRLRGWVSTAPFSGLLGEEGQGGGEAVHAPSLSLAGSVDAEGKGGKALLANFD